LELIQEYFNALGIEISTNITQAEKRLKKQKTVRVNVNLGYEKLSITFTKTLFVCCHNSPADLSMLEDFSEQKGKMDIVHKSFITLGKGIGHEKVNLKYRDTALLAPAGQKSLQAIGKIYPKEYQKIEIPNDKKGKMKELLKDDEKTFREYAIQDSVVTLHHANQMENFYMGFNRVGVPVTLSGLGRMFVLEKWQKYKYQVTPKHQLGDPQEVFTPQGLDRLKDLGHRLPLFISAYKGGRNESFMYGYTEKEKWYDYDLSGAYTSVLAYLGTPYYKNARIVFEKEVREHHNKPQ
jgi:hypothetical protein